MTKFKKNTHTHGELLPNAHVSLSEHYETMRAGAYYKIDRRRLRGACAFVQSRLDLASH